MFGFVTANMGELSQPQKERYGSIYCGICRCIRDAYGQTARLALSYDMVFLCTLLMSLYEPEETGNTERCLVHPLTTRPWVKSEIIRYGADMNVVLAYYNCLDDWNDDKNPASRLLAKKLEGRLPELESRYPRQCSAIRKSLDTLAGLEQENCPNPDLPAAAFGELMAELLVWREDFWAPTLRRMGMELGRFIYLMDAVMDYAGDEKKGKYNPFLAMGQGENRADWEQCLVLTMERCTEAFEMLPLVQDKAILDNILYSGVWVSYRGKEKRRERHDRRSL